MSQTAVLPHSAETFDDQAVPATRIRSYWQSVGYRLRHDKMTMFFGTVVILIVLSAILAPLLAPFDPYKESIIGRLKPLGWRGHLLGTDRGDDQQEGDGRQEHSSHRDTPGQGFKPQIYRRHPTWSRPLSILFAGWAR